MSRQRHTHNRNSGTPGPECSQARADMLAFLDGDLDGVKRRVMQAHLDACPECRREWEWERQAEQALQTAQRHVPPAGDLRAGFYARLADRDLNRRPSLTAVLRRVLPNLAIPAVAMAVLMVLFYYPQYAAERAGREQDNWTSGTIRSAPIHTPLTDMVRKMHSNGSDALALTNRDATNERVRVSRRFVSVGGPVGRNRSRHHIAAHQDLNMLAARMRDITVQRPLNGPLPPVVLPNVKPDNVVALNLTAVGANIDADNPGTTAHIGRYGLDLAKNTTPTGTTRAALLNEEVNVHIVDEQNVEVSSLHVTPVNAANANTSVIHVEAGLKDDGSAEHGETP